MRAKVRAESGYAIAAAGERERVGERREGTDAPEMVKFASSGNELTHHRCTVFRHVMAA